MAQAAGYRTPRFLTFKQALELGGNVRRGERGTKVYFVKQLQVRDQDADDNVSARLIPMMREYTVFNVDQCENLPDASPSGRDFISMPAFAGFKGADRFYNVAFQELTHWSGHKSRAFIAI